MESVRSLFSKGKVQPSAGAKKQARARILPEAGSDPQWQLPYPGKDPGHGTKIQLYPGGVKPSVWKKF